MCAIPSVGGHDQKEAALPCHRDADSVLATGMFMETVLKHRGVGCHWEDQGCAATGSEDTCCLGPHAIIPLQLWPTADHPRSAHHLPLVGRHDNADRILTSAEWEGSQTT